MAGQARVLLREGRRVGRRDPVVDGELWLNSLRSEVREAFAGGIRYVQNLHDGYGLGKSWQDTFETDDKAEVERYLAAAEAEWEWGPDGIRVVQHRKATTRHPVTGTEVWFNQADQWHPAGLGDETSRSSTTSCRPRSSRSTSRSRTAARSPTTTSRTSAT